MPANFAIDKILEFKKFTLQLHEKSCKSIEYVPQPHWWIYANEIKLSIVVFGSANQTKSNQAPFDNPQNPKMCSKCTNCESDCDCDCNLNANSDRKPVMSLLLRSFLSRLFSRISHTQQTHNTVHRLRIRLDEMLFLTL